MKYIFTEQALETAIDEIIKPIKDKIPYIGDREYILKTLWLNYNVELPFKRVWSIVTDKIIKIS